MAKEDKWKWSKGIVMLAAGTELAILVLAGLFLGNWIDRKWGTQPWGILAGTLVGTATGFYNFVRIINKLFR